MRRRVRPQPGWTRGPGLSTRAETDRDLPAAFWRACGRTNPSWIEPASALVRTALTQIAIPFCNPAFLLAPGNSRRHGTANVRPARRIQQDRIASTTVRSQLSKV